VATEDAFGLPQLGPDPLLISLRLPRRDARVLYEVRPSHEYFIHTARPYPHLLVYVNRADRPAPLFTPLEHAARKTLLGPASGSAGREEDDSLYDTPTTPPPTEN
jgi:hypothetical protein